MRVVIFYYVMDKKCQLANVGNNLFFIENPLGNNVECEVGGKGKRSLLVPDGRGEDAGWLDFGMAVCNTEHKVVVSAASVGFASLSASIESVSNVIGVFLLF